MTGWGVFNKAATEHAIGVLNQAIAGHGEPWPILGCRGSQFYAAGSEKKGKGVSRFEKHLKNRGIRHILARVANPQTNGKSERVHGELQRKPSLFEAVAGPPGGTCPINPPRIEKNPVTGFMKWYDHDRPHMSLDTTIENTPAMSFKRKMPMTGTKPTYK